MTHTSLVEIERMPYLRFLRIASRVAAVREREQYEAWVQAAFIGWQVVSALGAKVSFREYLRKLGIKEPKDG